MIRSKMERIAEFAELGRQKLNGSIIYGEPLDLSNIDHVLAALYLTADRLESSDNMRKSVSEIRALADKRKGLCG